MSDELPPFEDVLPAVEHVMGTLDHDAGRIQDIADRLSQSVGATLDSDKEVQKRLKGRLSRAINRSVIKQDGPALSDIAGSMRTATALSVDRDEQRLEPLMMRLDRAMAQQGVTRELLGAGFRPPAPLGTRVGTARPLPQVSAPPGTLPPIPGPNFPPPILPPTEPPLPGAGPPGTLPPSPPPVIEPPEPPPPPPPGTLPPCPPPVPCPVPPPVPARSACGPLPDGMPGVRVYMVPWLDPGDPDPTANSECGRKMIAEADPNSLLAAEVVAALATDDPLGALLGTPPVPQSSVYVIPGIREEL